MRQRYPFSLYAYALMSNHFHLLLEVHRFPTARILQSLLTGYVRRFFSDASNIAELGELSIAFLVDANPRCWLARRVYLPRLFDIDRMENSFQS